MATTTPSVIGPHPKYAFEDTASLIKDLNRLPLFMTEVDTTDGEGGSNLALEALQALAYEGTPFEIASNFKAQGNDCFKLKQYKDAAEYYGKAIAAVIKKDQRKVESSRNSSADIAEKEKIAEIFDAKEEPGTRIQVISDDRAEADKEAEKLKELVKTCYLNRSACNLELKNYRRAINDCAEVLKLQPLNAKAYYRSARACLAIDKIKEAQECVERGLELEPQSSYFKALSIKVMQREDHLLKIEQQNSQREVMKKHVVRI
ncbi:uncharacterized protein V1513DRAFT_435452 [Lipomyces chichibuensis]|uniref:uncharacterized protein n=1 Tax=Lipomyces chichibuensis TaxID=1546026 RepID=UPI0033432FD4